MSIRVTTIDSITSVEPSKILVPKGTRDIKLEIKSGHVNSKVSLHVTPAFWTTKITLVDQEESIFIYLPNGASDSAVSKRLSIDESLMCGSILIKVVVLVLRSGILGTTNEIRLTSSTGTIFEDYLYPPAEWFASAFPHPDISVAIFGKYLSIEQE
ncbi:MAG: hypothetical protein QG625_3279 [Cyanobacteriota bacterium erpe_2018_sw_39hr_WHONDRS-SW48-000098_B_bin.30]|jgi:hypothetical protein|nr:hypothetical protein [Cyanobacteriota bacterium erpe_2018_sw_39hr_WHONDRS-SW48-000098_B_bin.30]